MNTVLLHGLGSDQRIWNAVLPDINEPVEAVDLPGTADNPPLSDIPTPSNLASQLQHDTEGQSLRLVGHSLGGWVALQWALIDVRVVSVLLIAPAGLWTTRLAPKPYPMYHLAKHFRSSLPSAMESKVVTRMALGLNATPLSDIPHDDQVDLVDAYAGSEDFVRVANAMRASRFVDDEKLQQRNIPIDVLWCAKDRLIAQVPRRSWMNNIEVLPQCGHVPMWTHPQTIARHINTT